MVSRPLAPIWPLDEFLTTPRPRFNFHPRRNRRRITKTKRRYWNSSRSALLARLGFFCVAVSVFRAT